ncbi:MAG: lysophospholipid acyltransferase family protein [Candidatus Nealsonbacteria bacterium]
MKTSFIYFCKYISSPIIERFFLEKIEGKENIPSTNFILAPNHLDGKDHWLLMVLLKERLKNVRFVGAMDSLKTLFMSTMLYYFANTIKVNRRTVNREIFLTKLAKSVKENKIIVIYPEGDSNNKKYLLKGKTGIAELTLRTGIPVVPVGIRAVNNSFKRIITVGRPLDYLKEREMMKKVKDNHQEYSLLLRKITDDIMQKISKLSQKPYQYAD